MHAQDPAVVRLDTHLEDQNTIVYSDDAKLGDVQANCKKTKLTAWFQLNIDDSHANQFLYHDIPKHYTWKAKERMWSRRKNNKVSNMIGRMYCGCTWIISRR